MAADIVGLLPMGGKGIRLGLPFHKSLAPTIVNGRLFPLYVHALNEIRSVATDVYAIVGPETEKNLTQSLEAEGVHLMLLDEATLPGALGAAGAALSDSLGPDTLVVVALPDSIWAHDWGKSMRDVVDAVRIDGAFALFRSGADELDTVERDEDRVVSVTTKQPGAMGEVVGWGAFVIKASSLARLTGDEADGPQLGRMDMGWAEIGKYVDLGVPERYVRWHDTSRWPGVVVGRDEYRAGMDLEAYASAWVDMLPHIGTLRELAQNAKTIIEFGVRGAVSTWALLDGLPEDGTLTSVDIDPSCPIPPRVSGDPRWTFIVGDDLTVSLPEQADMLMIDSSHEYAQTVAELQRAAKLGPSVIALHDYLYFDTPDVRRAVDEFVATSAYRIETIHPSPWGLAVLRLA